MAKTVFITGASSGFGKASAKLFHQHGWNVIATMRSPEKETALRQLENVLVTRLDVQDATSIQNAINAGIERFQTIDVLINSAGYGLMGVFESARSEQIKSLFDVNVFGLMEVTRQVLPYLRAVGSATIINLSSMGGAVGMPFGSLYISSKFAVEGFSEALSHELASLNIRVKIIEPGSIATNFRENARMIDNKIPVYDPIMASSFPRYHQLTEHLEKSSEEDVAKTIYQAATDETNHLRYIVGADAHFFIDKRYAMSAQAFTDQMRHYFIG
ncbi:NADP-dependent 3-hydroxy acid dehydrogenase YdfG [Chitinophaga sp. YR627]|uniref:SDR family oxidoreductase n=1 Tax=Chitinophaga sp. YR627 TaxID=1881041 RepID=UPI0008F3F6BE|nr:SDR family oxidoreductase [Chitinophaga sp. YR627]SFM79702.1 NADP-dependent 3-hydroxy acid dehydrogenase YdfG [Chitinophaga sp. YR627]